MYFLLLYSGFKPGQDNSLLTAHGINVHRKETTTRQVGVPAAAKIACARLAVL